ncbi:hypothetical protein AUC71_01735 [Methyloceanibacter marginalis]|uniref:Uncharacterized protein n=1 Tax=Methyloceanibacter marginalis TaxID=1774971 RepID=A0A1E3W9I6_9HYPH|nr:hypothetical protein [Methyloceanibacter marginalis]ODS02436.1 hypothetical protein AUC71_01735 [Methyloceanibacter marginalis]
MVENLIAEGVGLLAGLLLITLLGGRIARWWSESAFDKKWRKHRQLVAKNIANESEALDNHLFYFGKDLIATSQKAMNELSALDHAQMQNKYNEIREGFDKIERFFESNHFCLRDKDQEAAIAYLDYTVNQVENEALSGFRMAWTNFEAMLDTHLRGSKSLDARIGGPYGDMTRHEFMRARAQSIDTMIGSIDRAMWDSKARALSESLRTP